ncbi:hypothetical protein A2865_03530 [Candidatus Woesebacteria bacterium RIFCSPHIGHO2_01_FULL_39_17]|uniref:DUF3048 domain-containing protein n=3 Tax=Candidatus Woeseibacteriota TaxID=1752722 RepID=A0A0G0QVF8_9BACT|nr:MAG: hypothetical protein US72_C0007G0022 [Microgenomates group bacterium GW2011_GWC1_38_12]KKQ93777.1 MAG: hypothetical protein UT19_C0007G0021 [Candidatus Woesebacteria bacterium GW2011_GWB1_39_10b]KKR14340.1 MAG: hypothetical protein UT40_C0002G0019 [Candidatus Woesebacteria bacterium GW2011_GWA1_39_21b]OGM23603.1 MAG: hypothetical protein A2865_03530 [Candidatus Woesebacteria bacterium RIFCSPHIGHO2_01_FULL_39_17]OGM64339.1 MAG: hypothetical protein A3A52_05385 [Candidatus Woesebacteria b
MKDNIQKAKSTKNLMLIVSFLGLYLVSAGTSWALFSFLKGEPETSKSVSEGRGRIDPNLPKTEECPINGKMFSKPERDIWEARRPVTAIIENHEESRPQSGLSYADVVYEAVAEGGITRFLSVFYCGASAQDIKIAPIRSIRVYFINWAAEYGEKPLLVHSGGANNICSNCPGGVKVRGDVAPEVDALKLLVKLSWRAPSGNAMDAGTNLGYPAVKRDQYRLGEKAAWEHSYEGYTDKIFDEGAIRGFGYKNEEGEAWDENFTRWGFSDDKPLGSPKASEISFEFWSNKSDYDVSWKYDSSANKYLRFNGGKGHIDHETQEQISAKNVVIQNVREKGPVDKEGHMFYTTIGEGKALFFQNGDVIEGTWRKRTQDDRTRFFDKGGAEISFVKGTIWIEAVPDGNEIKY